VAQDDLSIPSTPDSISPAWLTAALRRAGAVEHATVAAISVSPVAAGSGFVGQVSRLHIEYDRKESGAPATMFAKLSSADPAVRKQLRAFGIYEAEASFYRDLAAMKSFPLRVPRPYVSLYDDAAAASILLIEDLGDGRFGDNVAGLSPPDARIAVGQLALLHAHFWESPSLQNFPWLRSVADDAGPRTALTRAMLPRFEQRYAEFLTPSLLQAARAYADVVPAYSDQYSLGPQTLIHGDYRADNFAFAASAEDGGFVVFDWQISRRSHGARDLAYLLTGSLDTEQRRDTESSLLELYHDTLLAHGVKGYSSQDLARDFWRGLGAPLGTLVVAGGLLDFSSERGLHLARQICERTGAALADHQFVGHLEDLAAPCIHAVSGAPVEKHETYSGGYDPLILRALAKRDAVRDAAFFIPYLTPAIHILDCGCGPGGISVGLAALVPQGRVVGIDIQDSQLEMGRQEARNRGIDNVRFEHASVYKLPFADATFDAVLAHAMVYHLGEPMKALHEIRRVLKPGGLIGLRDADIDGDVYHPPHPELDRFWKLAEQVISHNGGDIRYGRRHRQILREAGFADIIASASSDSFGTPETTTNFSKYWTGVFLVQHRELILKQGWATDLELAAMRDALLSWGGSADAFYSRCRCEAVGRKPAV